MAKRVRRVGILLRPTAVAIKGYANVAGGLSEIEILDYPPLIKWIEQRFNLVTNTSEQFSAQR